MPVLSSAFESGVALAPQPQGRHTVLGVCGIQGMGLQRFSCRAQGLGIKEFRGLGLELRVVRVAGLGFVVDIPLVDEVFHDSVYPSHYVHQIWSCPIS